MKPIIFCRLLIVCIGIAASGLPLSVVSAQSPPFQERLTQVLSKAAAEAAQKPQDPRAHYLAGVLYSLAADDPSAEREFARALAIDPGFTADHFSMGLLYYALGMYEEASQEYQAFVAENPENAGGFYNLGVMQQCVGNEQAAVEAYEKAVALNPAEPAYAGNLSQLLLVRK